MTAIVYISIIASSQVNAILCSSQYVLMKNWEVQSFLAINSYRTDVKTSELAPPKKKILSFMIFMDKMNVTYTGNGERRHFRILYLALILIQKLNQ